MKYEILAFNCQLSTRMRASIAGGSCREAPTFNQQLRAGQALQP